MPNSFDSSDTEPSYIRRVATNDAVKKGLAGAAAGLLIAVVTEALWPSR